MSIHQRKLFPRELPTYPIWILVALGLAVPIILNFVFFVRLDFSDYDTLIYTLVGRGIISHGQLPYAYVFDHKPALAYLFYAPLAFWELGANRFVIFSMVFLALIGVTAHRLLLQRSVPLPLVLLLVTAAGLGNVGFSGNTELIYVLLQFVSVGTLIAAPGSRSRWLSALSAVAAFNINYAAIAPLAPAILYCLASGSTSWQDGARQIISFGLMCLLFQLVLTLAFIVCGGNLGDYLGLQLRFLSAYGRERNVPGIYFLVLMGASLALSVVLAFPPFRPKPIHRKLVVAMTLMMWFAAASYFWSGKFYMHYLYSVLAPASVLLLTLDLTLTPIRMLVTILLLPFGVYETKTVIIMWAEPESASVLYSALRTAVQGETVATMGSSVVPFFFSGAEPFHPFVWIDHANIVFGPKVEEFYLEQLAKKPSFVLTAPDTCLSASAPCTILGSAYEEVQFYSGDNRDRGTYGYRLYRAKA